MKYPKSIVDLSDNGILRYSILYLPKSISISCGKPAS